MRIIPRQPSRVIGPVLALVLASGLAACGSSDNKSSEDSAKSGTDAAANGCTPKYGSFPTQNSGTMSVVMTNYPPYGSVDKDNNLTGVDGDLLVEFAKRSCLKVDAKNGDAAAIPAMVQSNRVDVSAGDWWHSKARINVVDMTDSTYKDALSAITKDGVDTVDALKGRKIGDLAGSSWVPDAKKAWGGDYRVYRQQDDVIQDLKAGRIAAAIATPGSGAFYLEKAGLTGYQVKVLQPDPQITATTQAPQSGSWFPRRIRRSLPR